MSDIDMKRYAYMVARKAVENGSIPKKDEKRTANKLLGRVRKGRQHAAAGTPRHATTQVGGAFRRYAY